MLCSLCLINKVDIYDKYCHLDYQKRKSQRAVDFDKRVTRKDKTTDKYLDTTYKMAQTFSGYALQLYVSGQLKNVIKYSFDQRSKLEEIFRIGGMPLSNNAVEQCIRPTTLGRKNSLFSKSYDDVQTLDAYKYLKYAFEQLELRKNPDVDAYLP